MSLKIMQQPFLWKRFKDDSIESYVGATNEPVLDLRPGKMNLRLMDGVTPGGHAIASEIEAVINTPVIINPTNNAVDIGISPIITANAFFGMTVDLVADTHASSQWQVATDSNFNTIIFDSGVDTVNLTSIDLDSESVVLVKDTQYYVRVKYTGASGLVSEFSNTVSFTTVAYVGFTEDTVGISKYGQRVAISGDGNVIAIGDSNVSISSPYSYSGGVVWLFTKVNNVWTLQKTLSIVDTSVTSNNPGNENFGRAVCLNYDGTLLAVGAPFQQVGTNSTTNADYGYVYMFKRSGSAWTHTGQYAGGRQDAKFGSALAISKNNALLVVGGGGDNSTIGDKKGGISSFTINANGSLTVKSTNKVPAAAANNSLWANGVSTDQNGTIVAFSAGGISSSVADVAVADIVGGGIGTITKLGSMLSLLADEYIRDNVNLSDDGNTLSVISNRKVYVLTRTGGVWGGLQSVAIPGGSAGKVYRSAMSKDGNVITVGYYSGGTVYLFEKILGTWQLQETIVKSNNTVLGVSLSITDDGGMFITPTSSTKTTIFTK